MSRYSHRLPPHLGGWPCRLLNTLAGDGRGSLFRHVEYAVQAPGEPALKRIFVDPAELTELPPPAPAQPEPPSGGAAATESTVWLRSYKGWFDGFEGVSPPEFLTWLELNERHPDVRVLIYDPADKAPELPYRINTKLGLIALSITAWPSLEAPRTGALSVLGNYCELDPDELRALAAAMWSIAAKASRS